VSLRLGAYTRLSADRDGTETATARQRKACEQWAKDHGHKIVGLYRDSDLSGFKRKVIRPDFQRLLLDLDEGKIEGVVVWRTDRFTRRSSEISRFLEMVEGTGRQLFSVTEPFDNSAMGLYMLRAFVNNHEFESAVKAERLRAKFEAKALAGEVGGGGMRPFGFEPDRVTIRESEAEHLRAAVDFILRGGSLYSLAEDWARRGITSPTGKRWAANDLRRVLVKGRICGRREHRGIEVADAEWLPIISVETRDMLKAALAARWSGHTRDFYVRSHLLTGFLECSLCHKRLIAQRHSGVGTYVCVKSAVTGACGKVRVRGAELDDWIGLKTTECLDDPKTRKRLRSAPSTDEARAVADVRALEAKEAELAEQWANDEVTSIGWATARRGVEARLVAARRRLDQVRRARAVATLPVEGMGQGWDKIDIHQKRALIDLVIDRIDVLPVGKGSHRPVKDRVEIAWRQLG
jgi:DNA invertase Pin-like site-specific DNA recombinase